MTGAFEPSHRLVSDTDRTRLGQTLHRCLGQGRITVDDFNRRMAVLPSTRTRGDLDALVADLTDTEDDPFPDTPTTPQPRVVAGGYQGHSGTGRRRERRDEEPVPRAGLPVSVPGTEIIRRPRPEMVLRNPMGDIARRGRWIAPAVVDVNSGLGDIVLDFAQAELTSPITTVVANLGMGDLTIVIPDGASVDLSEARCIVGAIKNRTGDRHPIPGALHFVVRGTVTMGDIKVQHPKAWRFGLFTIHSPFRITWGRSATR
ncbi:MAG TPA: DUF1707 domain-containing protein [Pseudonocardiaceae bacterium]